MPLIGHVIAQRYDSDTLSYMSATPNNPSFGVSPPRRVSLFVTCLVDQFYPQVGESVVNVLERLGVDVDFPEGQTCCGQPAFNSGYRSDARAVAKRFLEIFDGEGPIVTPSGSCAAMVRNFYPELFHDEPAELERANRVGERLYEFSEFMVDILGQTDPGGSIDESITYHRSCHLLRELGVDAQPSSLIQNIRGLDIRPLERSEVCCGFGGAFAVKMPDVSTAMLDEKLDNVLKTGAKTLVAGDTGCIMHMAGGLRRRGSNIQVIHLAQLLDKAASANAAEPSV